MQLVRNNNIALLEMKTMVGSAVTICPLNHVLDAVYVFKRLFIDCLCESQAQTTLTLTTFWASGSWLKANTTLVYPLPAHPWQNHYELDSESAFLISFKMYFSDTAIYVFQWIYIFVFLQQSAVTVLHPWQNQMKANGQYEDDKTHMKVKRMSEYKKNFDQRLTWPPPAQPWQIWQRGKNPNHINLVCLLL